MDRKTSAMVAPLRTLGDDELSLVSGARHCHKRRRRCHDDDRGEHQDNLAAPNPSASPAAAPSQTDIVNLFQMLFIGNSGPINVAILNLIGAP